MKPKKTLKWTREMKWLMNIKSGQMGLEQHDDIGERSPLNLGIYCH